MQKYDSIIKQCLNEFDTVKIDSSSSIEKLILDSSAETELLKSTNELNSSIENAISAFAREHLYPKYEFLHVREQGLRIWGKDENIAISRNTLSQILHEMAAICEPDSLKKALCSAGCKSAVQFFFDFLNHLRSDTILKLPENEISFLNLLGSFDQRSAWWLEKPIIDKLDNRVNISLNKPFTTYPWVENDPHTFNEFLSGYFQTLFNCSSDFLRIINLAQEKTHKPIYCLKVRQEQMSRVKPKMLYIKLFTTESYLDEFINVDRILFCALEGFLNGGKGNPTLDISERPEYYRELITEMKKIFPNDIDYDTNVLKEMEKRSGTGLMYHENLSTQLFNEIQLKYQKLKIESLYKLDPKVKEEIEIEIQGVN